MIDIVNLTGGLQAAVVHRMPSNPGHHGAWLEWAKYHGIDPMRVPLPSIVIRDPIHRQITFTEYLCDDNGNAILSEGQDDVVTTMRTIQLDHSPLPFPEVTS